MYKFSICVLFVLNSILLGSIPTADYKITGAVVDNETGKTLLAVTVAVINRADSTILSGTITNEKGYFKIEGITEKIVRVKFTSVGYQSLVIDSVDLSNSSQLGLIKLKMTNVVMPDVIIKAVKPMIEFHADRQIINFDRLPGSTGSVTEALKNSTLVQVDPQTNKISVRGQDVKIKMDGHEYAMPTDMLAQLPASLIEQAEVILNPGAKESAEGGTYILNLISKKNPFDNYSGAINISSSSSKSSRGGLNLNFKERKLNLFAQLSGSYYEFLGSSRGETYNYNSKSMYYQNSAGESKNYNSMGYFRIGMEYNFDEQNIMSLVGSYNLNNIAASNYANHLVKNAFNMLEYSYRRDGLNEGYRGSVSFTGFYKKKYEKKGNELTFDILCTKYDNPLNSEVKLHYSNRVGVPQDQKSSTGVNAQTLIFRTDYAQPLEYFNIETGYCFTYRNRGNNYNVLDYSYLIQDWRDSMSLSNNFKYKEQIHALYGTIYYKNNNFEIKGGLRTEDLYTYGNLITANNDFSEHFLSFFPDMSVSYNFTNFFNLRFNAFRRVTYPQIMYINPFRRFSGPNTYFMGNPKLKPNFTDSYAIDLSQYLSVYYRKTKDNFSQVNATERDTIFVSSYINLDKGEAFGADLTLPYYNSPEMLIHLPDFISYMNIRISYLAKRQSGRYIEEDLSMTDNYYSLTISLGLRLWYKIDANAYLNLASNSKTRISASNGYKDLSLYLSKSFMSNKIRLNLSIADILGWQKTEYEYYGSNYYIKGNYMPQNSRNISIGVTYMFNDYKERRDRDIDDGRDKGWAL